jgi:hypothetical protein
LNGGSVRDDDAADIACRIHDRVNATGCSDWCCRCRQGLATIMFMGCLHCDRICLWDLHSVERAEASRWNGQPNNVGLEVEGLRKGGLMTRGCRRSVEGLLPGDRGACRAKHQQRDKGAHRSSLAEIDPERVGRHAFAVIKNSMYHPGGGTAHHFARQFPPLIGCEERALHAAAAPSGERYVV